MEEGTVGMGVNAGVDGFWSEESRYGCTNEDRERFMHGMDGSSPAVRLMLLVEKTLHAPRIREKPGTLIGRMDGGSGTGRRTVIGIAQGMDAWCRRASHTTDVYGDFTRWWMLDAANAAAGACSRRLQGGPDSGRDDEGRMMSLLAFAVRNEAWASRFADTLASFFASAARYDGILGEDMKNDGMESPGYRLADEGAVPARCIQALACMICRAFNDGYRQETGGSMVSPLSATLSMTVGRCLDAPTAAGLPMVADSLYGQGRNPMSDLDAILHYAAMHPHSPSLARSLWNNPGMLTIIPGGMFIGGNASNTVILQNRRADDAGMFAIITHPGFPDHMGRAVEDAGRLLAGMYRAIPENEHTGEPFHFPLLPYHTLERIAAAPARIIELMADPGPIGVAMQCDHDPEERSCNVPGMRTTRDRMIVSEDEAKSQRRGMMMACRICETDWSHHDTEETIGIIKAISPPNYDAVRNPMDFLRYHPGIPTLQRWQVGQFIASCMDTGRMSLASSMVWLAGFMESVNRTIGSGGTDPLDWDGHATWSMLMKGSMLRTMLEDDNSGLPDDFIVNDFLARVSLKPYRSDESVDPRLSRFMIAMEPERSDWATTSSYVLLIDWGA